jgi:hypothetical protein
MHQCGAAAPGRARSSCTSASRASSGGAQSGRAHRQRGDGPCLLARRSRDRRGRAGRHAARRATGTRSSNSCRRGWRKRTAEASASGTSGACGNSSSCSWWFGGCQDSADSACRISPPPGAVRGGISPEGRPPRSPSPCPARRYRRSAPSTLREAQPQPGPCAGPVPRSRSNLICMRRIGLLASRPRFGHGASRSTSGTGRPAHARSLRT